VDERFHHEYIDQTTLHPIGLAAILLLGCASLALPRRFAVIPIILSACFIAPAQRVVVLTLDFNMLRIMVVFGWIRLLLRGETSGFIWKRLDTVIILWMISGAAAFILLRGTTAAVIFKLGSAVDAVGMYFFFRCLITSWKDVDTIVQCFIVVSVPVAIAFLIESATGRNAFAVLGGVSAITPIRQGRLRCQGAFAHPIMAGCFWAVLLPLIAARWWGGGADRLWAVLGVAASMVIIAACASSTPAMGVLAGVVAAGLFPLRRNMRMFRWGVFAALVVLHFYMNAPVWHLISRVDVVGGSTGWHRYFLIDQAIHRVREWWLLGTLSTAHWGWGLFDVTNQYVLEAVRGGLLTLVLFVVIIGLAFHGVGRLTALSEGNKRIRALSWALGAAMFVHCVNFIGVSYFGQIIVIWFLLLAMIGSLTPLPAPRAVQHAPTARRKKRRALQRTPAHSHLEPV